MAKYSYMELNDAYKQQVDWNTRTTNRSGETTECHMIHLLTT